MEITAKKDENGHLLLGFDGVTFELPENAIGSLQKLIGGRLAQTAGGNTESLQRKIKTYRNLATKMIVVDDVVLQSILPRMKPEQLVTMVRLADGERLFHKVIRNLSRQNGKQFQQDYLDFDQITEHQACVYMEQILPLIKEAAQMQKNRQFEQA
ncbi:hypothetical protein CYQ88_04490 [Hydrogenovibrio sp. SC-1]|uniref:FliG C-terminal domain-containing protein n=1 Tax=Hydrogenovibrio sp. SC-1 TaxID=2065820 RepID=UPI000C7BFFB4|nr:FliG C-terminal domain-containing protein [Hydrogenovibrio sp. SC-1]PLA74855.1 hypothetical protein CYQ88_04490 [Hydrogenovibrio sp. SC-1]